MSTQPEAEAFTTHELAVSNMIGLEAIVGVLVRKGLVSQEEILEEVAAVRADLLRKARPAGAES